MKELVEGMKVRVRHLRQPAPYVTKPSDVERSAFLGGMFMVKVEPHGFASKHVLRALGLVPAARGGITLVELLDPDTDEAVVRGFAACSESENYVKKTGRELALERAVENLKDRLKVEETA